MINVTLWEQFEQQPGCNDESAVFLCYQYESAVFMCYHIITSSQDDGIGSEEAPIIYSIQNAGARHQRTMLQYKYTNEGTPPPQFLGFSFIVMETTFF